ncbi:hypothetical protein CEUSTIGMA_g14081.t1, partial [Chlamydomonas eustigma]
MQPSCLVFPPKPCALGIGKEPSTQNMQPLVTFATTSQSKRSLNQCSKMSMSCKQESLQGSNQGTLKDRLLRSKRYIRGSESFQTSGLASISSVGACSPFWTSHSKNDSERLWCPIATDLQDLDSSLLSTSSRNTEPWLKCFTLQTHKELKELSSPKTCSQSLRFLPQDITESEQKDDKIRCRKIRIYPNAKQLEVFNLCLRASRYIYNKANQAVIELMSNARDARLSELEALKATDPRPTCCHFDFKKCALPVRCMNQRPGDDEWFCSAHKEDGKLGISYSAFMSLPKLRPLVMRSDVDIPDDSPEAWLKQVPYDTRQG